MTTLTVKQEKFAQLVASGSSNTAAYREAYDSTGSSTTVQASKLAANGKVAVRIAEIQGMAAAEESWTRGRLLRLLFCRSEAAFEAGQFAASLKGLELIGKITGLLTDRVEHTGTIEHAHYAQLSMDQLQAIAAASEPAALPAGQAVNEPATPGKPVIILESGQDLPQPGSLAMAAAADHDDDAEKLH
jgi:hypothetical protein